MTSQLPDALIITRRDVSRVMSPAAYLEAVELGFRAAASGNARSPMPMELPVARGAFHAKSAWLSLDRDYVAVKVNGNFPGNPSELGLPTIQGAILLSDASNGALLAVIDSIEVSIRRTAAASALAAMLLARPDSKTLLICGCGAQGQAHAEALPAVLPIERCLLWDRDAARAEALATALNATPVHDLESAGGLADLIVTCTPSTDPFLDVGMVRPGTFIAAVGADNPQKSEVTPSLMAAATLVTDVTAQCATMGDLHHAIAASALTVADVHAELGQVLTGARPARISPQEIIIFDSTGTGFQDVSASAVIYQRCVTKGLGLKVALGALVTVR